MDAVKAKGRITGQVVSLDGTPIDGASVCFCPEDAPYNAVDQSQMPRTATDRRGCFILEPTAYYRLGYRLLVEERGSARSSIPLPIVFPNQTLELRTIVLSPGQVYHGRVTDLAGQPIRDAQIQISLAVYRTGHCVDNVGPGLQIRTDSEGCFVTPPLMLAAATLLQFTHSGFAGHIQRIQVDRVSQPKALGKIVLEPEVLCRMHFVNALGEPIPGVRVIGAGDGAAEEPLSDDGGIALIRGLKAQERRWFRAVKDGYISYQDHFADWETSTPIRVVLDRQGMISGVVVDAETGEAVNIDQIRMCNIDRVSATEFQYSSCVLSDFRQPRRGFFEIDYSSSGEKHLEVIAEGYQVGEAITSSLAAMENQTDICIQVCKAKEAAQVDSRKHFIRGRVTYRGEPVTHGWVARWKLESPCEIAWCNVARGRVVERFGFDTDYTMLHDGRFELSYLPTSQERYLVIESAGLPTRQILWSELPEDRDREVSIQMEAPASICGTVSNVSPGLEGQMWVVAFNRTGLLYEVLSEKDGRFQFHGLASGTSGLKAGHDGMRDPDVPEIDDHGDPIGFPHDAKSRPWDNAVTIAVRSGETIDHIEIRAL